MDPGDQIGCEGPMGNMYIKAMKTNHKNFLFTDSYAGTLQYTEIFLQTGLASRWPFPIGIYSRFALHTAKECQKNVMEIQKYWTTNSGVGDNEHAFLFWAYCHGALLG